MRIVPETMMFVWACVIGVGLGVLYDVFRMMRLSGLHQMVAVFLEDLLFFAAAGYVTFWFCLAHCGGWLRGFVLAGH